MTPTKIEWCDFTVNPIRFRNKQTGRVGHYCEKIASGCANCYASRMQTRFLSGLEFRVENRDKGELFFDESVLRPVLRRRKPATVFWADMSDMFGDWVPDEWIDRCAAVVAMTPELRHVWLTKRHKRMRQWFAGMTARRLATCVLQEARDEVDPFHWKPHTPRRVHVSWPLQNLIIGYSASTQADLDAGILDLAATNAHARLLSLEPLLGPMEIGLLGTVPKTISEQYRLFADMIHWVIVGAETGPKARPCETEWVRTIQLECQQANVPFFFKRWGRNTPTFKRETLRGGRMFDGKLWEEKPELLRF